MLPLSATDAITPAWQHTRRLLLGPRNPRLFFKIAAVAFFAEMLGFNSFGGPGHSGHGASPAFSGLLIAFIIFAVTAGLLIGFAFFYLSSRLQFTLFHIVLRSETTVAPIWRRYGAATWRWIGLKLLFFFGAVLCLAPILVPGIIYLIHTFSPQSQDDSSHILAFIFAAVVFMAVVMVFVLAFTVGFLLLRDFGLPSMALEATPLRETVRRVLALTRSEPGQVALYLLLRFCLVIAGTLIAELLIATLALIIGAPLGGLGFGLWAALHASGTAARAGMIGGWVILALALLAVLAVALISLFGYLFTFLQAYAIFFLAGRYPLLGQLLAEPPAPVRPSPQPHAWTPAPAAPPSLSA
jgi:hypothetical protein